MKPPEIITSKTGSKTVICFYTGRGWDEAVEAAEKKLGIVGEKVNVIIMPDSSKLNYLNSSRKHVQMKHSHHRPDSS